MLVHLAMLVLDELQSPVVRWRVLEALVGKAKEPLRSSPLKVVVLTDLVMCDVTRGTRFDRDHELSAVLE